jgi:hypothetical protein
MTPELPEPIEPRQEAYQSPSRLRRALTWIVALWNQSVTSRASFAPGFAMRTAAPASPAAALVVLQGEVQPPSSDDLAESPETVHRTGPRARGAAGLAGSDVRVRP